MTSDYHFITEWRFKASVQEIREILADATDLPRWWPSVYMDAQRTKEGDANHVGEVIRLYTKGYLPYTLRWDFTIVKAEPLTLEAKGDFVGRGIWAFEQQGETAIIKYDWKIAAEKPILKTLTPLMRPIFSWNHHWAMDMGQKSIELELARRRAKTEAERQAVPAPPPPTPSNPLLWMLMPLTGQKS
jgi:hypothetical protein